MIAGTGATDLSCGLVPAALLDVTTLVVSQKSGTYCHRPKAQRQIKSFLLCANKDGQKLYLIA